MLEILLIIALSKNVGAIAANKGHSRALYITLFIILWVFGELAGGVVGLLLGEGENPLVYLFALGGAACGALLGFILVNSLPDCTREEEDLELDQTGRPDRQPAWDADYFKNTARPTTSDSEHIQLGGQAPRSTKTGGDDLSGIQSR